MKSFCYYTTLYCGVCCIVVIIVDFIVIVTPRSRHFNNVFSFRYIFFFFDNSHCVDSFCWPVPNTLHHFTQCARQMNVVCALSDFQISFHTRDSIVLPALATPWQQQQQQTVSKRYPSTETTTTRTTTTTSIVLWLMSHPK